MMSESGKQTQRKALLAVPSIGALAVIVAVSIATIWSLLSVEPSRQPLDKIDRIATLQQDKERAVLAQAAVEPKTAPLQSVTTQDPLPAHIPKPLELTDDDVQARPLPPKARPIERSVVIQPGENLTSALSRLYIHGPTTAMVINAFKTLRKPRHLRAGEHLWARFEGTSPMDAESLLSLVIAPVNRRQGITIERRRDATATRYVAERGGLPGHLVRRVLRCGIIASLTASLARCGHGAGLATLTAAVLRARLSLRSDLRPGDELRVVFDELIADGQRIRYQRVDAVQYKGRGGSMVAFRFDNKRGRIAYFDDDGQAFQRMFQRPVDGRRTSGYGTRMHPVLRVMKPHLGIDWAAATGTPVYAASDGRISRISSGPVAGKILRISHAQGYETEYFHLSRFARRSRLGAVVGKGQVIAYVGNTGRSTGAHLHFGARRHGNHINPDTLTGIPGVPVAARDRAAFLRHVSAMSRLFEALEKHDSSSS